MVAGASGALESLRNLEKQGVEVLACGTCLDYFNLKNEIYLENGINEGILPGGKKRYIYNAKRYGHS